MGACTSSGCIVNTSLASCPEERVTLGSEGGGNVVRRAMSLTKAVCGNGGRADLDLEVISNRARGLSDEDGSEASWVDKIISRNLLNRWLVGEELNCISLELGLQRESKEPTGSINRA